MKHITALALALVLALGVSTGTAASNAHAQSSGEAEDVALTLNLSAPDEAITSGDQVTLTFRITNVGTQPHSPDNHQIIFLPPELDFVSASDDWSSDDIQCEPGFRIGDHPGWNYSNAWTDHTYLNCNGGLYFQYLPQLDPGEYHTFTINTVANADFTDGETSLFAYHQPNSPEYNFADIINAFDDTFSSGANPADINTNNIVHYVYDAPAVSGSTPTTGGSGSNNSSSNAAGANTSSGSSQSSDATNSDSTSAADGSTLTTDSETSDESNKKAEVALDVRNSIPDRISREDDGMWEALLSGAYKNQFIAGFTILAGAAAAFFILRKRYITKIAAEKEYQKALKIKKLKLDSDVELKVDQESIMN
jgi:hypothetical protein